MATEERRPGEARKERARATRRRMVEAAYRLFSERGWGVPLSAIAEEAGVAVQTVYFTFHNKITLLREALQLAVLGDDLPLAPHERPWFDAMVAEPDQRKAIGMVVDATLPIFVRVAPLTGVLRSGEPEIVEMWRYSEELRLDGYAKMVRAIASKGRLKVKVDEATDVMFMVLSPDFYWVSVSQRGWTPERWARLVKSILASALIP